MLLSLTIVGVIAVVTVPVIVGNVQKKIFATQVKNFAETVQQIAQQELIRNHTRDLSNTDFANPEKLMSEKHFAVKKICAPYRAYSECWGKIIHKQLNKGVNNITNAGRTLILKNGVIVRYQLINNNKAIGLFTFDVNGTDKPNVWRRDAFAFYVTPKGKIEDHYYYTKTPASISVKINHCKGSNAAWVYCFGALRDNNWEMKY